MVVNFKKLLSLDPFSLLEKKKDKIFLTELKKLNNFHYHKNYEFKKITDFFFNFENNKNELSKYPYITSSLFKNHNLISTNKKKIHLNLNSSGTSSNNVSKINLDFKTSLIQARVLKKLLYTAIDKEIKNIFILADKSSLNQNEKINAKIAAIKGFSQNYEKKIFLIENGKFKIDLLKSFLKNNVNEKFLIFGFTSDIWVNFVKDKKFKKVLNANNGIILHGGGWKKLENKKVSKNKFNKILIKNIGIKKVVNYYGMVEQTGSIFIECDKGYFHTSIFSDIIIRDKYLNPLKNKEIGIVQLISLLPESYPGHNILTEDLGRIVGIDDCSCGKKGKYFEIISRIPNTEIRGCSDAN